MIKYSLRGLTYTMVSLAAGQAEEGAMELEGNF